MQKNGLWDIGSKRSEYILGFAVAAPAPLPVKISSYWKFTTKTTTMTTIPRTEATGNYYVPIAMNMNTLKLRTSLAVPMANLLNPRQPLIHSPI